MPFRYQLPSTENLSLPAQKYLDVNTLDKDKISTFEKKHSELIKKLDEWILIPDRVLLPHLIKLGKIVEDMYKLKDVVIYRGMTVGYLASWQEYMGLADKTLLGGSKLKKGVVKGYKFDYTVANPISFSWDKEIAMAFGDLVVSCVSKKSTPRLVITDELSHVVSKLRNVKSATQREVIIFPPNKLSCKVISIP